MKSCLSYFLFVNYSGEQIILKVSSTEISGVREPGALEMLVNAPKEKVFGQELYPTIYDKGAILAMNLAAKHVFHNENKRTAYIAMNIFMEFNGFYTDGGYQEGIDFVLNLVLDHEDHSNFEKFKQRISEQLEQKYTKNNCSNHS